MNAADPGCFFQHDTTNPRRGGCLRHGDVATAHQTSSKAPGALLFRIEEALRDGARRMLQQAMAAEVAE
jgi:hypothetical protein